MTKKSIVNWKLFAILFGASLLGIICVMPFVLTLQSDLLDQVPLSVDIIVLLSVAQSGVVFFVLVLLGLVLSKKVGLGAPILKSWIKGEKVRTQFGSILKISIGIGVVMGFLIIVGDWFFSLSVDLSSIAVVEPPIWQGFLASFYGGINEEILMRLFLVSFFVWLFNKIRRKPSFESSSSILWISIVLSAIIFGIGHLPVTSSLVTLTPMIVLRAVVLNGIGGIAFGWLYWKKGLESAMISHFSTDIILYVVLPIAVLIL